MKKKRELLFYKNYFKDFYASQSSKVKNKILWSLRVVEDLEWVPEIYFKYLKGTDGLYEIRIQSGSDIFRIFSFFDEENIVVVGHGFQKKSQKTSQKEIERAERIKREYHEEKKRHKS